MAAQTGSRQRTARMVTTAMLTAAAFVLFLLEIPIFAAVPVVSFLKLDFSDIPALLAGMMFGPVYGAVVELLKNVLELMVRGLGSQMGFGNILNFVVGTAFVVPFSIMYRAEKKSCGTAPEKKKLIPAAILSTLITALAGALFNRLITPLFFRFFLGTELTKEILDTVIIFATILNVIKGVLLSTAGFAAVKPLKKLTGKYKM